MTEQKSLFTNPLIIGIIGSIISGLIVYFLLKSYSQRTSNTNTQTQEPQIQTFSIPQIENRLNNIEQKIQSLQITSQQSNITSQQPNTQITSQQSNTQITSQQPITTYKNSEKTNFILNDDGDIVGIETIRNAKID